MDWSQGGLGKHRPCGSDGIDDVGLVQPTRARPARPTWLRHLQPCKPPAAAGSYLLRVYETMLTVAPDRHVGILVYEHRDGSAQWSIRTPTETSQTLQINMAMEPNASAPPPEVQQQIAIRTGAECSFELVERDVEIGLWTWNVYISQHS